MNRPTLLKISFLLALLLLCAGLSWVGLRLALPRPEWVAIGRLADFPPAEQPYEVFSPVYAFVVNDGSQFLVLEPMNRSPKGVNVHWIAGEQAFIDPVRGSHFDLLGIPIRPFEHNYPVENQSLPRYEIKIEGEVLYIDLARTQVEKIAGGQ